MDPFYRRDGAHFLATESTRGPWSNDHQHGGPPSALLVRAAEALVPGFELARLTVEFLRPVPIGRVEVQAEVEKPGRKAVGVRAVLRVDGVPCLVGRTVLVRVADPGAPVSPVPLDVPLPDVSAPFTFDFFLSDVGYHTAVETRLASGTWGTGRCALWMRPGVALVEGEVPSGAQRAVIVADAASGVSAALDTKRFTFVNADLTVNLFRAPVGDWVLVDALTQLGPGGRALAESRLGDVGGAVGRSAQTLVVEARGA